MPNTNKKNKGEKKFTYEGSKIMYRTIGERLELEIDGKVMAVNFLDNGRPHTSEYVNVMATDVEDYARKFVDFHKAQNAHWDKLARKAKKEVK